MVSPFDTHGTLFDFVENIEEGDLTFGALLILVNISHYFLNFIDGNFQLTVVDAILRRISQNICNQNRIPNLVTVVVGKQGNSGNTGGSETWE